MPPSPSVVVIGSFVQDLMWRCREFPRPGETGIGVFKDGPGGKGSNQAVACGRAGVNTLFVGAVGRDAFGAGAKTFYRSEKIACRLAEKRNRPTGTAAILVNASGQNEIVVAPGANRFLKPADIPPAVLKSAKVVVAQLESSLTATTWALKTARRAGAITVLNPAPMRPDFTPALLAHVDILIPNETEFVALINQLNGSGHRSLTEHALAKLPRQKLHALCLSLGVATVIVTLGSRGCFVAQAHRHTFLPAHTGIRVVDTTGAGDAFVGGFAAGLVRFGGDIVSAARFGNAVAALSVTKPGTAPAMPHSREIDRFLKSRR